MKITSLELEKFNSRFEMVTETGCWLWTAAIDGPGYGIMKVNGKLEKAHRISWTLHNGDIPDNMNILHRCDTRPCVNPRHLFLGTQRDNMQDCFGKGRMVIPDNRGERCGNSKLTVDDILAIRSDNRLHAEIAKQYGIGHVQVFRIKQRQRWAHIP